MSVEWTDLHYSRQKEHRLSTKETLEL